MCCGSNPSIEFKENAINRKQKHVNKEKKAASDDYLLSTIIELIIGIELSWSTGFCFFQSYTFAHSFIKWSV